MLLLKPLLRLVFSTASFSLTLGAIALLFLVTSYHKQSPDEIGGSCNNNCDKGRTISGSAQTAAAYK